MKKRTLQLMLSLLMLSAPALSHAYGATYYYGIYQHLNAPFTNVTPIVNGSYDRQHNNFVSGLTRVVFATNYGFPPVENEEWRYEVKKVGTGEVLSYISFIWKQEQDYGCILVEVDGGGYFYIGCSYEIWQVYLVGSFYTRCFDTDQYEIATSHSGFLFDPNPFEPTPFQPGQATINGGSLTSIPPTLPPNNVAESTTLSVTVKDDKSCGKPLEDIPISVKNNIVPGSGSHLHFSFPEEIGTGRYVNADPVILTSSDSDTSITSTTDADGEFFAVYDAGVYGVSEKVTVTVTNPETGDELETSSTLDIKIPGLVPLSDSNSGAPYIVAGSYSNDCDREHNDGHFIRRSHYLNETVLLSAEDMANEYLTRTNGTLSFNDASLEYGGFFDDGDSNHRSGACHVSHRQGIDLDVNHIDNSFNGTRNMFEDYATGVNGLGQPLISILNDIADIVGAEKIREPGASIHYRFQR